MCKHEKQKRTAPLEGARDRRVDHDQKGDPMARPPIIQCRYLGGNTCRSKSVVIHYRCLNAGTLNRHAYSEQNQKNEQTNEQMRLSNATIKCAW